MRGETKERRDAIVHWDSLKANLTDKPLIRRVAIAGQTLNARTGKPVAAVEVVVARAETTIARTTSDGAGHFHFWKLPEGEYLLSASPGRGYAPARRKVTVKSAHSETIDLKLAPTFLHGTVTVKGQKTPVKFAEVRLDGGEGTYTDAKGQYGIELARAGKRTVMVSAPGFEKDSKVVQLEDPGTDKTMNFGMAKAGG